MSKIEPLLQCGRGTSRYYGVVNSWMKSVRNETGIFIAWIPAMGLRILRPDEVLTHSEKRHHQKARQYLRSARNLREWVKRERLDAIGQKRFDHLVMVNSRTELAVADGLKKLAIELSPVKSLPKPTIPSNA